MNKLPYIGPDEIRQRLNMSACIVAIENAMAAISNKTAVFSPRLIAPLTNESGFLGIMPGEAAPLSVYGAKIVSLHPENPKQSRPMVQGVVVLFDFKTGTPQAILDGGEITAIRTAAASGLAIKYLSRQDSKTHAILGTGVQARTHAMAGLAARPALEETIIWGRDPEKATVLAMEIESETGGKTRAAYSIEDAAGADIVSTVTAAKEPILEGIHLKPGAHINLVGSHSANSREADTQTIRRGRIWVDCLASAKREAGDLLIPEKEGAFYLEDIIGEIGGVVIGDIPGRLSDDEITIYKSLGVVVQDLYAAVAALGAG